MKKNKNFLKIYFFLYLLIISIIYFFLPLSLKTIFLFTLIVTLSLFIFYLIERRNKEINEIKSIIRKIRDNQINDYSEIHLNKSLNNLEEEINLMFKSWRNNLDNMKKLEQIRTEFLGNVSHELRTPIFTIQGYLETLIDGALEDTKVNKIFLQKAFQHTQNLNTLLNDLIDISMIESGQMKMSFRYFNIHELIKNIYNEFLHQTENKGLKLFLHSFNENLVLFGDKNRIKQVMINLISNAIKYTEKGNIEIGVIEEGNSGIVYVQDTGIGISEDDLPRIFERFYRVDKDRSREQGGTGLGLAIVKHILEAHESKIFVESKIHQGTKFYFRLKK